MARDPAPLTAAAMLCNTSQRPHATQEALCCACRLSATNDCIAAFVTEQCVCIGLLACVLQMLKAIQAMLHEGVVQLRKAEADADAVRFGLSTSAELEEKAKCAASAIILPAGQRSRLCANKLYCPYTSYSPTK